MKAGKARNAIFDRKSASQTAREEEPVSKELVLVMWASLVSPVKSQNVLSCAPAEEPTRRASVTAELVSKVLSVNCLTQSVTLPTALTMVSVCLENVVVSQDSKAQDVKKSIVLTPPVEGEVSAWMASVSVEKDGEETTAHNTMSSIQPQAPLESLLHFFNRTSVLPDVVMENVSTKRVSATQDSLERIVV